MISVLVLCALALFFGIDTASAGEAGNPASAVPMVVLESSSETECAPHGQGNVYAPCILGENDRYRMWYGGQGRDGHDRIHYAESTDGRVWTKKGVVLEDRLANHVNDPSVVKVGGKYWMFYTRTEKDVVDRIDVAVSEDGLAWEPKGVALDVGMAGSWDALSVGRPSVIHERGQFRMWYDGRKDFPPNAPVSNVPTSPTSRRCVGYATSQDGFQWERSSANPVGENNVGAVEVQRFGGQLLMAFESREGTRSLTSDDGINWSNGQLLAAKSDTPVDAFGHVTPCLFFDTNQSAWRVFVGAARAETWDRNCIAELDVAIDTMRMQGAQ